MAGITGLDDVQDTIDTIHEKALLTRQFEAIMSSLCWTIRKGKGHTTINVPYFSEVTATSLAEKVDMVSAEVLEDTNVQITPAEVGCKIMLSDTSMEDDREELQDVAGKVLGQAYEKKQDQDLLGQLDDGTESIPGTGATLTMGVIAAARAILQGNATSTGGPAPRPYVVVHHPYVLLDIVDVIIPVVPAASTLNAAGGAVADDMLRNYLVGRLFGMDIFEDGNISIDSTPDAKGGVFARGKNGSIIHGIARDMVLKPQRDESARATEVNCVGRYGVGEYLAGWIVELLADASTPD